MKIDSRDYTRVASDLPRVVDDAIDRSAESATGDIASVAYQEVRAGAARHRRSGRMLGLVTLSHEGRGVQARSFVRVRGRVAPIVVKGSRPHEIRRAGGRALHLFSDRQRPFLARVRHPGTHPDPFPGRAFMATLPEARHIGHDALQQEARAVARSLEG